MLPNKKDFQRFWGKVSKTGGCWLWSASTQGRGYGSFYFQGKRHQAHRWIFAVTYDVDPSGLDVCHTCDVTRCVRPDHLFLGTRQDNMRDCASKGRNGMQRNPSRNHFHTNRYPPRGEAQGNAKLTEDVVQSIRDMRADGMSSTAIAAQFGISPGHARKICTGAAWAHTSRAAIQPKERK